MRTVRSGLFVCLGGFCFIAAGVALAGEVPLDTPSPVTTVTQEEIERLPPTSGVDRIRITARKREEDLQTAPLAVSGFDEETLEGLGVSQTDDVAALAPNVYITQTPGSAANVGVSIRGIGGAEPLLTRDTGVGIYVDGAYIARTAGAVFDLIDLERVEVLRGPQGTLWGRNATGGAVNFISRRPKEEFGFEQTVGYGLYDSWLTKTTIDSGELCDCGLSSTFTYLAKGRDGYVNDRNRSDGSDPGAFDVDAFRVALGWEPVEAFSAHYSFDYSDLSGHDPLFQLIEIDPAVIAALHPTSNIPERDDDRLGVANLDFHQTSTHRIAGHNLTLDYDFDLFNVKSITTYREWDNTEEGTELDGNAGLVANAFGFPVPVQLFAAMNDRHQNQFSQELQFYGPVGERVDYVTGIYYFRETFDELNPQQFLVTNLASPLIPPGFGVSSPSTLDYDGEAESWAVFTDWSWTPPVLDDRLKLSAGVRYSDDEKSFSQRANPPSLTVNRSNEADWRHVDWQATTSFQFTDEIMTYVRVATGYKSGGFNPRSGEQAVNPTSLDPFDEEEVITYEAGAKTRWLDDRLQLNGAIFLSDYDDLQTDQFVAGSGGASSVTVNAGKAHIWGIELEALAQLTDNLGAYLNYGWLDMQYDEFEVLDPATNLIVDISDDAEFGYRPQQNLAAGLVFESDPLGDCGVVFGSRIDAVYVDDIWWHPTGAFNDQIKEGGYTLFNAAVSLGEIRVAGESRLKFTLWGRNLLDEEYRRSGIDFGALGFAGAIYGEPRTYGMTASFSY